MMRRFGARDPAMSKAHGHGHGHGHGRADLFYVGAFQAGKQLDLGHHRDREPVSEPGIAERARATIELGMGDPWAKDLPHTAYKENTLRRLAALKPKNLAVMHRASFRGDGEKAVIELAAVMQDPLAQR